MLFGYVIIKKARLEFLRDVAKEAILKNADPILNCGHKSCQFTTTDERGLKIHRSRVHKNK